MVRHAVVTLQRVVRGDGTSAGLLQWQTVVDAHSFTRIRIAVDDENGLLPPYDVLDAVVDVAQKRFASPNSFRVYYGDVEDLHLIASSGEWQDEAAIFVDECGDRNLSFTLMGGPCGGESALTPRPFSILSKLRWVFGTPTRAEAIVAGWSLGETTRYSARRQARARLRGRQPDLPHCPGACGGSSGRG